MTVEQITDSLYLRGQKIEGRVLKMKCDILRPRARLRPLEKDTLGTEGG